MAKPFATTLVPHISDRCKHTIFICYKVGLCYLEGCVFSKTESEEKVCEQNVYQGLTHVKWKGRKQYCPERAADP